MPVSFRHRVDRAAKNIAGKTGEERREAITAFLREAMIALLLGRKCP